MKLVGVGEAGASPGRCPRGAVLMLLGLTEERCCVWLPFPWMSCAHDLFEIGTLDTS